MMGKFYKDKRQTVQNIREYITVVPFRRFFNKFEINHYKFIFKPIVCSKLVLLVMRVLKLKPMNQGVNDAPFY